MSFSVIVPGLAKRTRQVLQLLLLFFFFHFLFFIFFSYSFMQPRINSTVFVQLLCITVVLFFRQLLGTSLHLLYLFGTLYLHNLPSEKLQPLPSKGLRNGSHLAFSYFFDFVLFYYFFSILPTSFKMFYSSAFCVLQLLAKSSIFFDFFPLSLRSFS